MKKTKENQGFRKKKFWENPVYLKAGAAAFGTLICFAAVFVTDNSRQLSTDDNGQIILERGERGENSLRQMDVQIGEQKEKIDITVSGQEYDREELTAVFRNEGERLEKLILGENESLDHVQSDLDLVREIPDSGILVSWESDNYDVIDVQGNIRSEKIDREGVIVMLTAHLRYGEEEAVYEFCVKVFPPETDEAEQTVKELKEQISKSDEETKTEEYMILPSEIEGKKVTWKYATDMRAFGILVLGAGASCMIVVSSSQRKKEEQKKAECLMRLDYPQIINKFNLYIRAGMTVRRAWFLIAHDYDRKYRGKGKRKAYDEMICTMYQIQGGAPEGECYENYGIRCGISSYRKFGMLLSQNLRKGSKGLTDLLGREAEEAFEDRKNLAKKLGEEAGTKLMIPLFMMLIIVFAIVIVPAFFSIQI